MKTFQIVLLMSCMLGVTACVASPPCNRLDVQIAYDKNGKPRLDATTVTNQCFDRMLADLDACYPKKSILK